MSFLPGSDRKQSELLVGKVLGDLSQEERFEVAIMLQDETFRKELEELERTAAAIQLAALTPEQELPESLRARLETETRRYRGIQATRNTPAWSWRESTAWVSCAAALLLCFGMWASSRSAGQPLRVSAALARTELLETANDVLQLDWAQGTTPFDKPVNGDVVWSNANQSGYMRFTGMPVNTPTLEQYQLWIIDPGRDDEPIDGGVFNISESGEIVIPIHAKLKVVSPQAFAITVEKSGGVVVSTQARLPLLAAVK